MKAEIQTILSRMTLEEKISLCNGADFWHSKAMAQYGIPAITMSDGPHGLRCQKGEADMLGVNNSLPSTCFPTAVTAASSWDPKLVAAEGRTIGEEGLSLGVDVVLGPGVCMKRDPRCGRNFEYFSEDPFLAGKLGAAWVRGAQSTGIGTSVKHFAANNQEYKRFNGNSQLTERALREIYLPAFEETVKQAQPDTVMCAYNMLNGEHCSDSRKLLTGILRDEWGFAGLVVTDWGALCDRVKAMNAGCDLSMPGGSDYMEDKVAEAVRSGALPESAVDACAARVIELALKSSRLTKDIPFDTDAHHEAAKKAALGGAVLLKNEDHILPVTGGSVVLIGDMAKNMRYQGAGSSHITPTKLVSLADAMPGTPVVACCDAAGAVTAESLKEAAEAARKAEIAIVCAGLPDIYESEGFDRENLKMPEGHVRMIEAVASANPNTVVVLFCGSVVEIPWIDKVKAVLYMGLPGQAGGEAAMELLTGAAVPCGKLAETWPVCLEDVPTQKTFGRKYTHYSEDIYIGYRYYEKADKAVRFPFGFGLSYTTFGYDSLEISGRTVTVQITNTGTRPGHEIVQLYVAAPRDGIHRPVKELKGFRKIFLNPGESKSVTFTLDDRSFAVWHQGWVVPGGAYTIAVGVSSADIRLSGTMEVDGQSVAAPDWQAGSWYEKPVGLPNDRDFCAAFGGEIQPEPEIRKGKFTLEMSSMEMKDKSKVMSMMFKGTEKTIAKAFGGVADYSNPTFRMMIMSGADAPLRAAIISSGGTFPSKVAEGMLEIANGRLIRGLKRMRGK